MTLSEMSYDIHADDDDDGDGDDYDDDHGYDDYGDDDDDDGQIYFELVWDMGGLRI
ncbi:hypothetical protein N9L19_00540 [bacterium]|nr:hypothetical protein [bacterium]MDA8609381.1 hypothetical protein [bacterium]